MHRFIRKIDSLFRRARLVDSLPRIKSDCISVAVLWSIIRIFCNFDKDLWTLHIPQLSYHISPLSQQWYILSDLIFLAFIFGSQPFSLKRLISYLWPHSCFPPLSAHSDLAYLPQGITGKAQFIAQAFCLLSATIATSAPSHSAHSPEDLDQYTLPRNSTGPTMMEFPPANGDTVTEHGRELHPEELSHSQSQHKYSNDILYSCFVILSFDILHCDINAPLF
ncbi:hypothetical protein Ddc_13085 [Ditylenchus destructor]|nr:hypothetical protein Ddc_13085 [Ditylenchus destructor]